MKEEWVDIDGYDGLYQISNLGNVYSTISNKMLKPHDAGRGYYQVRLYKDGVCRSIKIYRLVAQMFIPNPDNKPQVNHIDENPKNNSVYNLEWVTNKENCNYGTRTVRSAQNHKKQIVSVSKYGVISVETSGIDFARKLGVDPSNIFHVLAGKQKTVKGYRVYPLSYLETRQATWN